MTIRFVNITAHRHVHGKGVVRVFASRTRTRGHDENVGFSRCSGQTVGCARQGLTIVDHLTLSPDCPYASGVDVLNGPCFGRVQEGLRNHGPSEGQTMSVRRT